MEESDGIIFLSTDEALKNYPELFEKYFNNEIPINSYKLKKRILRDKLKPLKCEACGLEKWNGVDIPLELHHINGDNKDNSFENLKLLCPNCHALTDNYRNRK